jgi:hypothetical protein
VRVEFRTSLDSSVQPDRKKSVNVIAVSDTGAGRAMVSEQAESQPHLPAAVRPHTLDNSAALH